MTKTATKVQKTVQVLNRYELKSNGKPNGIVVYEVKSSNGIETYQTTLVRGHASSCTCKSRKPCYHMVQLEAREQEREAVSPVAAKVQEAAGIRDAIGIGDRGHLNGGPKAFSVLAV